MTKGILLMLRGERGVADQGRGMVLGDRGDVCDARAFSDIACRDRLINLAGSHYVLKRIYSVTQVWLTEESGMVVSVALNEHCCETQTTCGVNRC